MCELCKMSPCHDMCPNHKMPKASFYCSICDYGIYSGDYYIRNNNNRYAHLECVDTAKRMAEFLGFEVECMDDWNE